MLHSFKATFINVNSGEVRYFRYDSVKPFLESWENAISYFNRELLKLDKTWIYSKVEHWQS